MQNEASFYVVSSSYSVACAIARGLMRGSIAVAKRHTDHAAAIWYRNIVNAVAHPSSVRVVVFHIRVTRRWRHDGIGYDFEDLHAID